MLVMPVAALAATGDVVVTATMPAIVTELTAPIAVTMSSLYGTTGTATSTGGTGGTVLCTDPQGYGLTVVSSQAAGKLIKTALVFDAPTGLLVTAALATSSGAVVTPGAVTGVVVLLGAPQTVGSTVAAAPETGGTNTITLSATQAKSITAEAGDYVITLTFTATAN